MNYRIIFYHLDSNFSAQKSPQHKYFADQELSDGLAEAQATLAKATLESFAVSGSLENRPPLEN